MQTPYALRFAPIFRDYIWGGRRLQTDLNKPLPGDGIYAESWEVVDHGEDQSVVTNGPLAGRTLSQLVLQRGEWLLGRGRGEQQFPLLFKFLDCNRKLSIQVHPNDEQAKQLDPPDLGKTEAWVILSAEPDSRLYAGLQAGVDRAELKDHLRQGTVEEVLHQVQPRPGDCIFIPAGTVHALGEGMLVAEIQQASNTTFRLFDWKRVDSLGNSRPLHIDQGLAVVDFERGPVDPAKPLATEQGNVERLVECDKFILERIRLNEKTPTTRIGGDGRCHIVAAVEGHAVLDQEDLACGETVLIPAACEPCDVLTDTNVVLLDMYLPE